MSQRHRIFLSYHHANDEPYKQAFERLFCNFYDVAISRSVQIGDIDPQKNTEYVRQIIRDQYLRDTSVTVVLIGRETWKRKHVDWEISSSLRHTSLNPRSGLLGIILPTYPKPWGSMFNPYTIPPRLYDNLSNGYATIHEWTENPWIMQSYIHAAFERRNRILPVNSRDLYSNNRSDTQTQWQP